jgi:hypothetical protein
LRNCVAMFCQRWRRAQSAADARREGWKREGISRKWDWQAATSCSHYNVSFPYFISVKIKHIPYNMQLWQMNPSIFFILANPLKLTCFSFTPLHGDHRGIILFQFHCPLFFFCWNHKREIFTLIWRKSPFESCTVLTYCFLWHCD